MNKSKVPGETYPHPQQVVKILETILPNIANNSNSPRVLDKVTETETVHVPLN